MLSDHVTLDGNDPNAVLDSIMTAVPSKPSKQVIYASDPEFERITRYSDRSLASGKYIVRWIDDKNRLHLQGNERLTTVGWDGKERTDKVFDRPPTLATAKRIIARCWTVPSPRGT